MFTGSEASTFSFSLVIVLFVLLRFAGMGLFACGITTRSSQLILYLPLVFVMFILCFLICLVMSPKWAGSNRCFFYFCCFEYCFLSLEFISLSVLAELLLFAAVCKCVFELGVIFFVIVVNLIM